LKILEKNGIMRSANEGLTAIDMAEHVRFAIIHFIRAIFLFYRSFADAALRSPRAPASTVALEHVAQKACPAKGGWEPVSR